MEELGKRIIQAEPDKTIRPDGLICGDAFEVLRCIEPESVDLLFADPPYNLSKKFGEESFRRKSEADYEQWLDLWIRLCKPLLKPRASIY
ncbi:DNA methyltransferase, partial [Escherichia coli]|nr:DNA methyltransferase [Escherichia coli]